MLWRNDFVMYHVLPRFFCYCYFITHIKWDIIISASLTSLLKVWIWYRCENRTEHYYHHDGEQLGFYKKSTYQNTEQDVIVNFFIARNEENWAYRKSGTQDLGFGTLPLRLGTRDFHMGPVTWDSAPGTRHPICGNRDTITLRGMRDPYFGTFTLIQFFPNL